MSKYLNRKYNNVFPYVPGEQPIENDLIKLNTNESPFPPSALALIMSRKIAGELNLYSDPECRLLTQVVSEYYNVDKDQLLFTNGSDEALNFAFMAFCANNTIAFPKVTYGLYKVLSELYGIDYLEIPNELDFSINIKDYFDIRKTVVLANPNAQTGLYLNCKDIIKIIESNPDNVIIIDEAYVDFGNESMIKYINDYENLLVIQTFSKSRSLAGGRLGLIFGNRILINDLKIIKNSINPYNVNKFTQFAGVGAILDKTYFSDCCNKIIKTRNWFIKELESIGFYCTDSKSNFVLVKHISKISIFIFNELRKNKIIVRHFKTPELNDYLRITIGNQSDMEILIKVLTEIVGDNYEKV